MDFETRLAAVDVLYTLLAAGIGAWSLHRARIAAARPTSVAAVLAPPLAALGACFGLAAAIAPLAPGHTVFAAMRYLAAAAFLVAPALALGNAAALRSSRRRLAGAFVLVAALDLGLGVRAFLVEPGRLAHPVHAVPAPARAGLGRPVRIVHLSDIQTDSVGAHEERALAWAAAQRPDLLVITGDFLQLQDEASYRREAGRLRPLLSRAAAAARAGAFAVWGNVDPRGGFPGLLAGTGVTLLEDEGRVLALGGVPTRVTGLSLAHGFSMDPERLRPLLPPAPPGGLHLAFAHAPDFAAAAASLGTVDLALAGHTHGGQVVVPGFGPPVTLSKLPRAVAAGGLHRLGPLDLVVSRGVGMERSNAPRLRLFCPPEAALVEWGGRPGRGAEITRR